MAVVKNVKARRASSCQTSQGCLFFLALLFALPGLGASLQGRVVSIADGDTLTVLVDRTRLKVRLADIDAPEARQPFGKRSKQSLSELCYRRPADIQTNGKDQYGNAVARVRCAGKDANAEQVRRGMAWTFTRHAPPDSPLYELEYEAKAARRGLWRDRDAVAPWEWRQLRR